MIDYSNIGDRKLIVDCLKHNKASEDYLTDVVKALRGKVQVSSDVVTECGKATVRIRIKVPLHNYSYAHWITDEAVARDCERLMRCVLGLRWRHRDADIFDQSVSWQDTEEAVAGAMYEMVMEAAGDDVRKLHARVLKILDNRAKLMSDVQAKARNLYANEKKKAIKEQMRRICKHLGDDVLSEEDILIMWREVLVEEVNGS